MCDLRSGALFRVAGCDVFGVRLFDVLRDDFGVVFRQHVVAVHQDFTGLPVDEVFDQVTADETFFQFLDDFVPVGDVVNGDAVFAAAVLFGDDDFLETSTRRLVR